MWGKDHLTKSIGTPNRSEAVDENEHETKRAVQLGRAYGRASTKARPTLLELAKTLYEGKQSKNDCGQAQRIEQ